MNEHGKYYDFRRKSFSIKRLCGVHTYRGSAGVRYEWVVLFWYAFLYTIPQYVASWDQGDRRVIITLSWL